MVPTKMEPSDEMRMSEPTVLGAPLIFSCQLKPESDERHVGLLHGSVAVDVDARYQALRIEFGMELGGVEV